MSLIASRLREEIYSAIRSFTCATVSEAEEAARAIVRLVENSGRFQSQATFHDIPLDDLARGESFHPGDDS